jgi:hypothetical protein
LNRYSGREPDDRLRLPELAGIRYGETSIRNVLGMSSGVPFRGVHDGDDDLTRFTLARNRHGSIAALRMFERAKPSRAPALTTPPARP